MLHLGQAALPLAVLFMVGPGRKGPRVSARPILLSWAVCDAILLCPLGLCLLASQATG